MNKKRRNIIYVDASLKEGICYVGLFDLQSGREIRVRCPGVETSIEGEYYALLLGVYYSEKNKFKNPWVLSDNEPVTRSELANTLRNNGVGISWIPREANFQADAACNDESISPSKYWPILSSIGKATNFI